MGKKSKRKRHSKKGVVVDFPGVTKLNSDASRLLNNIADQKPQNCIVICHSPEEITFHSSFGSSENNLALTIKLLEEIKICLLTGNYA